MLDLYIFPTPVEIAPKVPSGGLHVPAVANTSGSYCSFLTITSLEYAVDSLIDGL